MPLRNPPFSAHQKLPEGADPKRPGSYAAFRGQDYAPDLIAEQARRFLRDNRDRPFFLYFPHYAVHTPLQAKPETVAKYEKVPAAHGAQLVAAVPFDAVPGLHEVQVAEPAPEAKVPAAQAVQVLAPAGLLNPALQGVQLVWPEFTAKVPAAHAVQAVAPDWAAMVPGRQGTQSDWPAFA